MPAPLAAITGWLLLAALALGTGGAAGYWLILPRAEAEHGPSFEWLSRGASRFASWAGMLLSIAMVLFFVRQLAEFRDPYVPWTDDAAVLLSTSWGRTWMAGAAGAVVLSGAAQLTRAGRMWAWIVVTVMILPLGAFPAFTGHAAGADRFRFLALAADTVHVWAAGGWIGGLAMIVYVEHRWRRSSVAAPASLLPRLVPAFSGFAQVCVVALILTGVFAGWRELSGVSALWATRYGRVLSTKLLLVTAVLALGALNWKRLTPRLHEPGGTDALRRAATTELLLMQAVLFVTAILVRTSPM